MSKLVRRCKKLKKIRFLSLFLSTLLVLLAPFCGIPSVEVSADAAFEAQLASFPESYKPYLRELHQKYPSWVFYADRLSVSFNDAVEAQYSVPFRKAVNMTADGISWRSMQSGVYDWGKNSWNTFDNGNWTSAAREVIAYYMDPRNFLEPTTVYMFLQQSYDPENQTEAGLRKIISGTFLNNGYNGNKDAYVNDIMSAAEQSGVSPYIIAATIIIEQGTGGTSQLISGTYSGYEGYYNFFNFGATGSNVVAAGLSYAKSNGWNSRSASIVGGAKKYAGSYVGAGQDTYYYKDFNVRSGNYSHQYAQNVYDARASAAVLGRKYVDAKLDTTAPMSFYIPVYSSIPNERAAKPPETDNRNNYYLSSMSAVGMTPAFSMYHYSYSLTVTGDTSVSVSPVKDATIISASTVKLAAGKNTVPITVKAQTGYTNTYTLTVNATVPCTLKLGSDTGSVSALRKGDTNGDNLVNVIDLANVQKAIVGRIALGTAEAAAADTNSDGKINVIDLANVQKAIVGRIKL